MTTQTSGPTTGVQLLASPGVDRTGDNRALRLIGATAVAAIVSSAANTVLGAVSVRLFDIPEAFEPLTTGPAAQASIVVAIGAGITVALLNRFSRRPVFWFYRISLTLFVLLFGPLVAMALAEPPEYPGTNVASIGTLALMHIVCLVVTVPILRRAARS